MAPFPLGLPAAAGVLVRFATAGYTPALFAEHAIDCPRSIVASVPRRQAEYLAGRLCARAVLAILGIASTQVGTGSRREPVWPGAAVGSITHSAGYALALAAPGARWQGLGIDIELVARDDTLAALASLAVAPSELAYLHEIAGAQQPLGFLLTLVFSAKESFFKASYGAVGRYFGFEAVRVAAIDVASGTLVLVVCETLCAGIGPGLRCPVQFRLVDEAMVVTWLALAHAGAGATGPVLPAPAGT